MSPNTDSEPQSEQVETQLKIRILIVEDHTMVREGIKRLLEAEPGIEVVGGVEDGREALLLVQSLAPDVVVMDISLPSLNGIRATQQIRQSGYRGPVLGVTAHEEKGYLREFFEAGGSGYLLKRSASEDLIRAIRTVFGGGYFVDQHLPGKLISAFVHGREESFGRLGSLSERESEVLRLIALGYSNKEVAAQLQVSVKTVETYKSRAMDKLQLKSRVDIIALAAERGWFPGTAGNIGS